MPNKQHIQQQLVQLRAEFASSLSQRVNQMMAELKSLTADADSGVKLQEIFRQVHSLSGSSGTFGFSQLSEHCRQLELILKEFINTHTLPDAKAIDYLQQGLQQLHELITRGPDITPADTLSTDAPAESMISQREAQRLVFIVEADAALGQTLCAQLSHYGFNTQLFSSAADAIPALKQTKPDVLVLDIVLPEGPSAGIALATDLPALLNGSLPCLFISFCDDWVPRLAAVRAGGVAYLKKPLDISMLADHLDRLTQYRQSEPYRVLVVDDSLELAQHYALVLRQADMHAEALTEPSQILDMIESFKPELILLDLYFPGITGIEIATVVRQHQHYASIPVVFLSTETDRDIQLKTLRQGDVFLEKPIADAQLVSVIETRIKRAREFGQLMYHDGMITDLSELKAKENEIMASKTLSEAIIDNAVDAVITIDDMGSISLFSPAAVKLFGYSSDEVLGKNVKMLMPEPYRSEHDGYLSHHKQTGEKRIIGIGREVMGQRKDGSTFPMNLSVGKAVVDGKSLYVGTVTDLTELKTKEQALRDFSNRLELATKAGGIGVWDYDIDKGILQWDDRMFELYGVSRNQFSGAYDAWKNALHPDDLAQAEAELTRAMEKKEPFHSEFCIIWPDGQKRYIQAFGEVMPDDKGRGNRMIGVNQDITQRKLSEQAMKQAKRVAEEANQQKSAFLNTMSHELRTPLTVILGYLPILKNQQQMPPPETVKQIAEDMDISGQHLMEMINDLLDISKIEAGQMTLDVNEVQVLPLIEQMLRKFKYQANKKHIQLLNQAEDFSFRVDERRLRQILINLIGNALKFTEKGQITVSARDDDTYVRFSVTDTGVGIAEQEIPLLFNTFHQVDNSSTRKAGGSGLGLAITKRLVELHGGSIKIESKPGEGSTFTFTIKQ